MNVFFCRFFHITSKVWRFYNFDDRIGKITLKCVCLDVFNAPSHPLLLVQLFMVGKNLAAVPHPPYSPDLAQCDFWLFPKLKMTLKGKRFETNEDIKANTTDRLKLLKKEDFHTCFRQWQKRWNKTVAEGEYFEGD